MDAALGHRYLGLLLTNCGPESLVLDGPPAITPLVDGRPTRNRIVVGEPRPGVTVPGRGRAYLGLEYLVGDRGRLVDELVVDVAGSRSTLHGRFDLDEFTPVTTHLWTLDGADVWPR